MKTLILTSTPTSMSDGHVLRENRLVETITSAVKNNFRLLFVASDPYAFGHMESYFSDVLKMFADMELQVASAVLLDSRNAEKAAEYVTNSDLIYLAGGHVPTENAFFESIHLRELLDDYDGVILGCSAGSMNCADIVYCSPEEPGEAVDPSFRRYIKGLGLTKTNIHPHYQLVKDDIIDGLKLFDDIILPDSANHQFYIFVDGTYLYSKYNAEEIRGEAYLASEGTLTKICDIGESISLPLH